MQDIYKNIAEYNPVKKRKVVTVLDDLIADMIHNKKFIPVVTKLFVRDRELNISLVFITKSYFKLPKYVKQNTTHYFIKKIPNKWELQQIAINHSSDIGFEKLMEIYKKSILEKYSFSVNETTLSSDNLLHLQKMFQNERIINSWRLMIKLKMKSYNMILIEKLQNVSTIIRQNY